MDDTETGWEMPSEAEMKVIQARRERSDKISVLMSEYLLKGYKMLSTNCNSCDTILLQDKRESLYCVACEEIDCSESAKDEPALSESAARRQAQESQFSGIVHSQESRQVPSSLRFPDTGTTQSTPSISNNRIGNQASTMSSNTDSRSISSSSSQARLNENLNNERNNDRNLSMETEFNQTDFSSITVIEEGNGMSNDNSFANHRLALEEKMDWACMVLKTTTNVGKCIELVSLVKMCAEALGALRDIETGYQNSTSN